jgi:hypothetical protein
LQDIEKLSSDQGAALARSTRRGTFCRMRSV